MPIQLDSVPPPSSRIARVARRGTDPFGPPAWQFAGEDGTFGGRFDDPRGRGSIPVEQRFRIVYAATTATGAFGETLARLRPAIAEVFIDHDYEDDADEPEPVATHLAGTRDPDDPRRGLISASWRSRRVIATTQLDRSLRFADLASPVTLGSLRSALADVAHSLGLTDVDFGTVLSPNRAFTQECARLIYQQRNGTGEPLYAGIRYLSRLNPTWECWAIFGDQLSHSSVELESILPDHPALLEVAALFNLTIELTEGQYIRPS